MIDKLLLRLVNRIRSGQKSRATFYYSGSSLVCQSMRFLGILISTRRIQADQFGIMASAVMVCALTSIVREFGQNSALLSSPGVQPGYARTHFLLTICSSGFGLILIGAALIAIPPLSDLRPLWPLLLFQIIFEAITITPMIVAQKNFAFRGLAFVEMTAVATWLLITILAAWRFPFAFFLVAAKLGETVVRGTMLFAWQFPTVWHGRMSLTILHYYFRFAKLLAPKAWIETFGGNLDVLLLKVFTNNIELGVFDRTMQLLRIPLSLSVNLIDAVAGASYSREQDRPEVARDSLRKFSIVVLGGASIGVAMVQLFLWLAAGPILGSAWRSSIEEIWLWAIPIAILRPFVWNQNVFFQATGRRRELLLTLCLATGLLLILGIIATPLFGIRGLLVALALSALITLGFQIRWTSRDQKGPPAFRSIQKESESS